MNTKNIFLKAMIGMLLISTLPINAMLPSVFTNAASVAIDRFSQYVSHPYKLAAGFIVGGALYTLLGQTRKEEQCIFDDILQTIDDLGASDDANAAWPGKKAFLNIKYPCSHYDWGNPFMLVQRFISEVDALATGERKTIDAVGLDPLRQEYENIKERKAQEGRALQIVISIAAVLYGVSYNLQNR